MTISWYTAADGTERPTFSPKAHYYAELCSAVSRSLDLARVAVQSEPGDSAAVADADARTALDDWRIAHSLTLPGVGPEDLDRYGLLTNEAMNRIGLDGRSWEVFYA